MNINTTFEKDINAFVVCMPENITLKVLKLWKKEFLQSLTEGERSKKSGLLLDTNKHQFESIECLKLLRNILSNKQTKQYISTFACIQPIQYRKPNIVSSEEGYFANFEDAYSWLQNKQLKS